jgi:predicted AAA+ superfamily ATPase
VLDTLRAAPCRDIRFWRDKQQREVDFVLPRGREAVDAIECKWNPDAFESRGLQAFRENYPRGRNYLLSPGVRQRSIRTLGGLEVVALPIERLREEMAGSPTLGAEPEAPGKGK